MVSFAELQFAGFWMAMATFLGIWCGHVGVRWLEAHSRNVWLPAIVLMAVGLALNIYSLFAPTFIISGVSSIFGITVIWDGVEMFRQQRRVKHGHSPANPDNPRHAAYLAAGGATTEELLDRDPQGVPIAQDEDVSHTTPPHVASKKHKAEVKA